MASAEALRSQWVRSEADHARGQRKLVQLNVDGIGYTHAFPGITPGGAAFTSKVVDSLFVGETDNIGNPTTKAEIAYGRSQPNENTDYPIRGYEYYDFGHALVNDEGRRCRGQHQKECGSRYDASA